MSNLNNGQNDSPLGQPRTLVLFLVVFLFLFGWQYMIDKLYPKPPTAAGTQSSAQNATQVGSQGGTETSAQVAGQAAGQNPQPTGQSAAAASASNAVIAQNTQSGSTNSMPRATEQTFDYEDENVIFKMTSNGLGLANFKLKGYKDRDQKPVEFAPKAPLFALSLKGQPVPFKVERTDDFTFVGTADVEGGKITRTFKYVKEKQFFESKIEFQGSFEQFTLGIDAEKLVPKNNSIFFPSFEFQDFVFVADGTTKSEAISTLREGEGLLVNTERVSLGSIGTQYFTAAAIDRSDILPSLNKRVEGSTAYLNLNYSLKDTKVSELNQVLYVGAKQTDILGAIDPKLPEVMNYGMFGFISKPLLKLLKLMHEVFGNWGLALIAMTIIVRLLLLPFNVMSFRSAQAMQRIKPQMDRVRELYKNDPMRMNKETMAIMKENNANPVSGCLPMLLQIPIFFALWKMISTSVELYQQPFFGWITDLSQHDSFFVLPILMGITMYLQQKMTPTTLEPMQQKILNFMPIIFTVFMLSLPSGLTLYNLISSLFGVIQQYFLLKDQRADVAALKAAKT